MQATDFVQEFEAVAEELLVHGTRLELSADGDWVRIEGLSTPPPRRHGRGSKALAVLCAHADRHGVILAVDPEPVTLLVSEPIPVQALETFYRRAGFAPLAGCGPTWVRHPSSAGDPSLQGGEESRLKAS